MTWWMRTFYGTNENKHLCSKYTYVRNCLFKIGNHMPILETMKMHWSDLEFSHNDLKHQVQYILVRRVAHITDTAFILATNKTMVHEILRPPSNLSDLLRASKQLQNLTVLQTKIMTPKISMPSGGLGWRHDTTSLLCKSKPVRLTQARKG